MKDKIEGVEKFTVAISWAIDKDMVNILKKEYNTSILKLGDWVEGEGEVNNTIRNDVALMGQDTEVLVRCLVREAEKEIKKQLVALLTK
jgi:lysyl-tRNA synthetase class II